MKKVPAGITTIVPMLTYGAMKKFPTVYANLSKFAHDFQYELFWGSCRKRTRTNSNQTFYCKTAQEGKIWCI
jgi:hypothetical protein